jgi:chromate reductase
MTTLLGIAGSLRRGSFNAALLRTAMQLAPDSVRIETGSIREIPLYDGNVEASSGIPESVQLLKQQIVDCDALLLVTPEYNNGIPGVFKNAIDWLSRPSSDIPRVFGGRPVALMGASPGGFGTILAQDAWLAVLKALGTQPWFGARMMVSRAGGVFNESGELTDDAMRGQLRKFLEGFAAFARSRRASASA